MRDRVDKLGVSEPEIRKQGDDQIVIQLAGVNDPETAAKIIGKTAQLELYDLEANLAPPSIDALRQPVATSSVYDLLAGQQALADEGHARAAGTSSTRRRSSSPGPVADARTAGARASVRRQGAPKGYKLFGVPPGTVVISCGVGEVVCPGVQQSNPTSNYYYLFKYDAGPRTGPRDDRRRPEALRHAAGLRHARPASRSC